MGKHKRKFIDKKNASRYHLMHRSNRDVAGEVLDGAEVGTGGMVLWPDPNNNPEIDRQVLMADEEQDKMREWRQKLAAVGLLEDYDEQYLKPITGTGTFLSANGKVESAFSDPRSQSLHEDALAEVTQQFEGIPLAADCMDEDIEKALMGDFEEGDFEEIADDFVLDAAKEPENDDEEAFDFDAHIQKLMEDARRERMETEGTEIEDHDWAVRDQDFFAKSKPLHALQEEEEEDSLFGGGTTLDVTPGVVPKLHPEEERALCEQFEKTLAEYDSDEVGDIEEEEVHGDRPLEGDKQVEAALDDYLQEKEDDFFMRGKSHEIYTQPKGGSGFSALVGTRMVPVKELDGVEIPSEKTDNKPWEEELKEAKKKIQSPELEPPPEEIFIDGKSYYSMKERNPWDCESILSTYSNLDNNPATIGTGGRRKKKKNQKKNETQEREEELQKIVLSNKTGLPVFENPISEEDEEECEETIITVNRGAARKKKETPEERKARKAQVKQERQMARVQKKATKEVFKEEHLKRADVCAVDDLAGKAVFRYS